MSFIRFGINLILLKEKSLLSNISSYFKASIVSMNNSNLVFKQNFNLFK